MALVVLGEFIRWPFLGVCSQSAVPDSINQLSGCLQVFQLDALSESSMQVLALILFVYLLLAFYTLTAPFLPSSASHIALQVLYGLLALFTLGLGVTAT